MSKDFLQKIVGPLGYEVSAANGNINPVYRVILDEEHGHKHAAYMYLDGTNLSMDFSTNWNDYHPYTLDLSDPNIDAVSFFKEKVVELVLPFGTATKDDRKRRTTGRSGECPTNRRPR